MKNLIVMICLCAFVAACSSNDDGNEPILPDPIEMDHYSLILNGAGFFEQRVELSKDTINSVGVGVLFSASDRFGNVLAVVVPTSGEASTTIEEYDEALTNPIGYQSNAASFFIGNTVYRSQDGIFTVSENEFIDPCVYWRGNLNINFTQEGNAGNVLNVQGTFDIPTFNCEE